MHWTHISIAWPRASTDRARGLACALLLASVSGCSPGPSNEPVQPSAPASSSGASEVARSPRYSPARQRYAIGVELFEEGEFARAAAEFEAAYELEARPALLYNVYVAYRDAGDRSRAAAALERYLEEEPEPPARERLQAVLASLRAQLAQPSEQSDASTPASEAASDDALDVSLCPPGTGFSDWQSACEATLNHFGRDDEMQPGCVNEGEIAVEGASEGELFVFSGGGYDSDEGIGYGTYYLGLNTPGGTRVLAEVGHRWSRSCSWGDFAIRSAEWTSAGEGQRQLLVGVHHSGEYSCTPSPWEQCVSEHDGDGDTSSCDERSDESPIEVTNEMRWLRCVLRGESLRCNLPGSPGSDIPLMPAADLEHSPLCPAS